ncbi:hypothetical protein, partial [Flagellimonas onchidii]|uniref:hypothetical protein n=1 Tax=Flagellimonas onchidii TaxID=2562684 RepID=UPI00197AA3AB
LLMSNSLFAILLYFLKNITLWHPLLDTFLKVVHFGGNHWLNLDRNQWPSLTGIGGSILQEFACKAFYSRNFTYKN